MCDFNSTIWRLLGQDVQMFHLPTNSHSEMVAAAGWRENEPNRKTLVFEGEWHGVGEIPPVAKLLKNNASECPVQVERAVVKYYTNLKEALGGEMKHFLKGGAFADVEKFCDVWEAAMKKGYTPDFSGVKKFSGYVYVQRGATFTAPALAESGSVDVREGATFTAPALAESGSVDVREGATFTAPALVKVSGSVDVREGATFTAPKLKTKK
jgi:hypothetical protein